MLVSTYVPKHMKISDRSDEDMYQKPARHTMGRKNIFSKYNRSPETIISKVVWTKENK